jgi:large subunit ribosomal protein L2
MIFRYSKRLVFRLSKPIKRFAGRNNTGSITVRHKVGGLKRRTRVLDVQNLKRSSGTYCSTVLLPRKFSFASIFEHPDISYTLLPSIQNQPFRFAPCLFSLETLPSQEFVFTRLKFIKKVGLKCSYVQFSKSTDSRIATAPGSSIKILRQGLLNYIVRIPSGEIRKLPSHSFCFLGQLRSPYVPSRITRAGFTYSMGSRPSVRGVAINPVDHPHGGNTSPGKNSLSPWAKFTKAKYNYTRNATKASSSIILYRRFIKKKFL